MPTKMYMSVEKLAFALKGERHEFKIYSVQDRWKDLLLVCRGSHSSADLADAHLGGDHCEQYKRIGHDQDHISWLIVLML